MVHCPDCNEFLTQHTPKYIHKKRGYCKGAFQEEVKGEVKEEVKKKSNLDYRSRSQQKQ